MYDNRLYASGVYGVFIARWKLICETPLVVRNGMKITSLINEQENNRGAATSLQWKAPRKQQPHPNPRLTESEVASLYYGYEVINNQLISSHFFPPSSLRGSLRSWTINHLIRPEDRKGIFPPSKVDEQGTEQYLAHMRQALSDSKSGYQWIASLFGMAFDSRSEENDFSNAGRLRVETSAFLNQQPKPIAVNGAIENGMIGPLNAQRQLSFRNPLDRVTHASKKGGLHHFLEFCKGESFVVTLRVLNPQPADLGVISVWRRELDAGMLRLGALSSIGRGRVSIDDQDRASYQLWLAPGAKAFTGAPLPQPDKHIAMSDALAGLWNAYVLPAVNLSQFEAVLENSF